MVLTLEKLMTKKVLITVGGTGGHVFPALTLAKQLAARPDAPQILFVGGGLSKNRYFERETFPYKDVACGTLPLRKPWTAARNCFRIARGIWQSRAIIRHYQPDLIVGFGSYHTLPTLAAAKIQRIPILLHEANRIPGKVIRLFSPYATLTGVHFPDTERLRGNVFPIPIPLREGFYNGSSTKAAARAYFNLDSHKRTLLIFGGSQGAQALNHLASQAVAACKERPLQVMQFTGDPLTTKQLRDFYADNGIDACVKDFEPRMDLAWQAADAVIARSGAGTMAEQLEFEVPGILIPYPFAADNHQESNALFMVEKVGGAYMRRERHLTAQNLADDLNELFKKSPSMKDTMHRYKNNYQPQQLCDVVCGLLK